MPTETKEAPEREINVRWYTQAELDAAVEQAVSRTWKKAALIAVQVAKRFVSDALAQNSNDLFMRGRGASAIHEALEAAAKEK